MAEYLYISISLSLSAIVDTSSGLYLHLLSIKSPNNIENDLRVVNNLANCWTNHISAQITDKQSEAPLVISTPRKQISDVLRDSTTAGQGHLDSLLSKN